MQSLFSRVLDYSTTHHLFKAHDTIIIGFSAGPDSRALLSFFCAIQARYKLKLIAVYINHHWREQSQQEAAWCVKICKKYAIECRIVSINSVIKDIKYNGSQEEHARRARRTLFASMSLEYHAQAIALAHHSDDQIETFFIRLIRGAHLEGLKAMQPKHGLYIRPFLSITKQEILNYLNNNDLSYYHDSSNDNISFLRNNIRHTLIKKAQAVDERFSKNCLRSIDALRQTHDYVQSCLHKEWLMITKDASLNIALWQPLQPFARKAHLLRLLLTAGVSFTPSERLLDEIERFVTNTKSNKHTIACWTLYKNNNYLMIKS